MRTTSRRTTIALDAIKAAVDALNTLPPTEERARLLVEAEKCEQLIRAWCDKPPSAQEREDVMRQALGLNVAVARLKRG